MSDSVVTEESGVDENVDSTESQENTQESTKSPEEVLTEDLQRLQAEYANYRKRVERDRAVASEIAIASVLNELLPLLDGLDRAAEHEELTGGFKAIADQLASITSRIGLEKFGEAGTQFDPQIHDALMHETSADVLVPTASKILQPGYKFKERILRPASVAVTDPAGE